MKPIAPRVDLTAISPLTELVIRAGTLDAQQARLFLINGYEIDTRFSNVYGLSTVFHQGANLDDLAKTAHFPHNKIGYSIIARIQQELGTVGSEMILFITPTPRYPDHHTLGVMQSNQLEKTLPDSAADALLRAFTVVSNPYRGKP